MGRPIRSQRMAFSSKPLILVFNYRARWSISLTDGSRNKTFCLGDGNFTFFDVVGTFNSKICSTEELTLTILCHPGIPISGQFSSVCGHKAAPHIHTTCPSGVSSERRKPGCRPRLLPLPALLTSNVFFLREFFYHLPLILWFTLSSSPTTEK